jgi:RNA polymerase sigma-70 factor (ECF subfamily)
LGSTRINYWEGNRVQVTSRVAATGQTEITKLVASAAGGNFEAFGKLYHIYVEQIYRYVFYQVRDKMTAEDITEDVFVRALDKIQSCKGRESTFSSWLYRIAHNRVIDSFRSARKDVPIKAELADNLGDPKQQAGSKIEQQELLEAISQLPQYQKQFIVLKFIDGLDNRTIGRIMGKSQVAVRLLQLRATKSLRQKLGGG